MSYVVGVLKIPFALHVICWDFFAAQLVKHSKPPEFTRSQIKYSKIIWYDLLLSSMIYKIKEQLQI